MEGFGISAILAVLIGVMLLPLLLIPYVRWRGSTGSVQGASAARSRASA